MPLRRFKISVIDDDESTCRALSRLLKAAGFTVQTYFSAEAFLDDVKAHTDFVVTDVQLRGMSGFELKKRLNCGSNHPPVAFITAHDEKETRDQAQRFGCAGYLRKPFSGRTLVNLIRETLEPGTQR